MNKNDYHKLLVMRASEEAMFFELIRTRSPREVINNFPINHKRAWYLLGKWSNQGIYDYGVTLDLGWVVEEGKHDRK